MGFHKTFDVKVMDPSKICDGIKSHIVYRVTFTVSVLLEYSGVQGDAGLFSRHKLDVTRRFSDFLGLHARILGRHLPQGIVVPPAPDKDLLATTKLIITKDSAQEAAFLERRRLALERFLVRLLEHPVLCEDPDLHEFLEFSGALPRSIDTQLLSGSSAKRIFRNFGDALGKMTNKVDEPDEWFDLKLDELDCWERQLKPFQDTLSSLASTTQALSISGFTLSRTVSQLANIEEHTGLAQVLVRLSETEDEASQSYSNIAEVELVHLVSWAHDLLGVIQACKDALDARAKAFRVWHSSESLIRTKREQRVRLELSGRADPMKFSQIDAQLAQLTARANVDKERFTNISTVIKGEFTRADVSRFRDFKQCSEQFLETLLGHQNDILRAWESYHIRAKSLG